MYLRVGPRMPRRSRDGPREEGVIVALFRRKRAGQMRTADSADVKHLVEFAKSQTGVEAFVEPRTAVTETTMVLVAASGEWTRRRVAGRARRTPSPTGSASRPTTPRWSATRSGCASGTAAGPPASRPSRRPRRADLSPQAGSSVPSASSSATCTRVRTAAPVPPLGV